MLSAATPAVVSATTWLVFRVAMMLIFRASVDSAEKCAVDRVAICTELSTIIWSLVGPAAAPLVSDAIWLVDSAASLSEARR